MDFTRLEAKLDKLDERLDSVDKTLAVQAQAMKPLSPDILICALQDVVHKTIGKRRLVKAKRRLTAPAP